MTRFETLGRIIEELHQLDDAALTDLLAHLTGDITDETLEVITYGKDDTEHLKSSSTNSQDLEAARKELKSLNLIMPLHAS